MIIKLIPVELKEPKNWLSPNDHRFIINMMILGQSSVFTALSHSPLLFSKVQMSKVLFKSPRPITHESASHRTPRPSPDLIFSLRHQPTPVSHHKSHCSQRTPTPSSRFLSCIMLQYICCLIFVSCSCHGLPTRARPHLPNADSLGSISS
jgi:hypothetical protein